MISGCLQGCLAQSSLLGLCLRSPMMLRALRRGVFAGGSLVREMELLVLWNFIFSGSEFSNFGA